MRADSLVDEPHLAHVRPHLCARRGNVFWPIQRASQTRATEAQQPEGGAHVTHQAWQLVGSIHTLHRRARTA